MSQKNPYHLDIRIASVCQLFALPHQKSSRTTVLQAHSHHWLGSFSNPGNGEYRQELAQACQAIIRYAGHFSLPLSSIIIRLDGLYGSGVVIADLVQTGLGCLGRCKDYGLLDLPAVHARLMLPPDQQTIHPASGARRDLFDLAAVPLSVCGPVVRLIVATHPATSTDKPRVGVLRKGLTWSRLPGRFHHRLPGCLSPASRLEEDTLIFIYLASCFPLFSSERETRKDERSILFSLLAVDSLRIPWVYVGP